MEAFNKDQRNTVKRIPKRGHYDKATVYEILDDGFLCHVGFVANGQPFVIPTAYGRSGDTLYLHGSSKSRMMLALEQGIQACITVTHFDGLVLARSTFHHSMNYRSAVVFGQGRIVEGAEKMEALEVVTENILKGRWDETRLPNEIEMKATTVIAIDIDQASAKVRNGPPGDEKEDYALPIWAGVLPVKKGYELPINDPLLTEGIPVSKSVVALLKND